MKSAKGRYNACKQRRFIHFSGLGAKQVKGLAQTVNGLIFLPEKKSMDKLRFLQTGKELEVHI